MINKINLLKQLIENDFTRELVGYKYDVDKSSTEYTAFDYGRVTKQAQLEENYLFVEGIKQIKEKHKKRKII
jgi:hypothetical protein